MKKRGERTKNEKQHRKWGFIARHKLLFLVCGSLIIGGAVLNIWAMHTKNGAIEAKKQASSSLLAQLNTELQETREKKAAQALAAQQAAEAAKSGTSSTIDSKMCNNATAHIDPTAPDVMVNKKHCIQPLAFAPDDLVTVHGATLSKKAADAFTQLFIAAAAAGQPFYVTSSYRSYANQAATYNQWVATSGQAGADTYSARPGYSEHQTGFAFDVAASGCALDCFGTTPQYAWFQLHAADYGFIQRYYAGSETITGYMAEEWHYRYVGVHVARDMQARGIKTLEEYWHLNGGSY